MPAFRDPVSGSEAIEGPGRATAAAGRLDGNADGDGRAEGRCDGTEATEGRLLGCMLGASFNARIMLGWPDGAAEIKGSSEGVEDGSAVRLGHSVLVGFPSHTFHRYLLSGRIILCMDSDDAGKAAVERLCSNLNSNLSKLPDLNGHELYVATLPPETKDPSDYVAFAGGGSKAGDRFQREVLDESVPWDEWYASRLLSRYDADARDGTRGSFSDVCEGVSTFLSTFPNPADRTRRVHKIAERLADLVSAEDESERSSSSLSMLRVQLASDILNMSSRKAGAREAVERRIERADGVNEGAAASRMERLSRGEGALGAEEDRKMSRNALARAKEAQPSENEGASRQAPDSRGPRPVAQRRTARSFRATRKSRGRRRLKLPEQQLVPHFDGFTFEHRSDQDWLGYSDNGVSGFDVARRLFVHCLYEWRLVVSHRSRN